MCFICVICVIYMCYICVLRVLFNSNLHGFKKNKKQISFQKEQIQREERRSEAAINYQSNNIET